MADTSGSGAAPRRLWKIVLVLSLALNLAVVGLVSGVAFSGRFGDGPPRSFDLGLGPVARALAPQERREMGRSLRQSRVLRGVDLRADAEEMIALLQAEPFDPAPLRDLLDAQVTRMAEVQRGAQEALLQTITAMSPERRATFAQQLADELRRRPDRRAPPGSGG